MKYIIQCNEGWDLASWNEPRTKQEVIETFIDYAENEWEEVPPKKWFTFDNIQEMWNVSIIKVKEMK